MIPIPRSILIHSATLQTAKTDRDQNPVYTTVAVLTRIHVEEGSTRQIISKDGTQKQLAAILFFDARNSAPVGTTFAAGQYVLFSGREYRIETVEPQYEKRKLHHYEVGLCG